MEKQVVFEVKYRCVCDRTGQQEKVGDVKTKEFKTYNMSLFNDLKPFNWVIDSVIVAKQEERRIA